MTTPTPAAPASATPPPIPPASALDAQRGVRRSREARLIFEAIRFSNFAAGEGLLPLNAEADGRAPEVFIAEAAENILPADKPIDVLAAHVSRRFDDLLASVDLFQRLANERGISITARDNAIRAQNAKIAKLEAALEPATAEEPPQPELYGLDAYLYALPRPETWPRRVRRAYLVGLPLTGPAHALLILHGVFTMLAGRALDWGRKVWDGDGSDDFADIETEGR